MTIKMIVEMRGGSLVAVHATEGFEYTIIDHDEDLEDILKKATWNYSPDSVCTEEGLEQILKEILEEING